MSQGVALGAAAIEQQHELSGAWDPTAITHGVVAKLLAAGTATPMGNAVLIGRPCAVEEAPWLEASYAPIPAPVLEGTPAIPSLIVVPFLRLVIRKEVASVEAFGLGRVL